MEKKSLKDAITIKPKDEFVRQGSSGDRSTSRQRDKSPKPRPVKVSFYWDPETNLGIERLNVKFQEKYQRKLTRSELVEALVKIALKNEKILDQLA